LGNGRRKDIICAAQEVFSTYGLADANVSTIAKKAGVVDSIIYHYFKNKEDLLFYALADRMIGVENELKLHLEGIIDPVSRLGKMVWFHLWLNDISPSEFRLLKNLLFECRANKPFYSHEGYKPLKNYMKIMLDILQQGVASQVFHGDFNPILVRNMIFGLLDEESLSSFAFHEVEAILPDFQGIMDLILAMISVNDVSATEKSLNEKSREEKILNASERIFAEKGYHAATMSEIAKEAGVAEGTIYTCFNSKQELLFSLPEKWFKWLSQNMEEAFDIKDPLSKLHWFIRVFFRSFLSHRDFLKVFLLDIKLNRKFYESPSYSTYLYYVSSLETILDEGKRKGFFRENIDNRIFRNLLLGSFTHLATRWFILEKATAIEFMQQWDEVVTLMCKAVVRKNVHLQVG